MSDGEDPMLEEEHEEGDEGDPSLGDRAKEACMNICFGMVLFPASIGFLIYNQNNLAKAMTNDATIGNLQVGDGPVDDTLYMLAFLGFIGVTLSIFCCLRPIAESMDAITDMVPCLPDFIEAVIDGMATGAVGCISCLSGLLCTCLVTGLVFAAYNPTAGGIILLVCVVLCCCVGGVGSSQGGPRSKEIDDVEAAEDEEDRLSALEDES